MISLRAPARLFQLSSTAVIAIYHFFVSSQSDIYLLLLIFKSKSGTTSLPLSFWLKNSTTFQVSCDTKKVRFWKKLLLEYWILRNNSSTLSFYVTLIAVITNSTMLVLHFLNSLTTTRFTSVSKKRTNREFLRYQADNDLN